jgi:hypothetical protein
MYVTALMQGKNKMKMKLVMGTLALGAALLMTTQVSAQEEPSKMTKAEYKRQDSLALVRNNELRKVQVKTDAKSMSVLKNEQTDSKVKAKEADRVKKEADDAAKQSKNAYKTERKAQKARKQADAQAEKALKSREKSDKN